MPTEGIAARRQAKEIRAKLLKFRDSERMNRVAPFNGRPRIAVNS
jgi:hypothetical protein